MVINNALVSICSPITTTIMIPGRIIATTLNTIYMDG
jgi:hypothetical protein